MDNLNFKKLPSTVLPTVTGTNAVIAETDDGKLYRVDSGGAEELAYKSWADGKFVQTASLLDKVYPVGSIFLSTSQTSPASLFGGSWTQITNDAYLKIVTTNAGTVGGTSSSHKIPISSMPAHSHTVSPSGFGDINGETGSTGWLPVSADGTSGNAGGGNAYYPFYYGIYMWRRTA